MNPALDTDPAAIARLEALARLHNPSVGAVRICWRRFGEGPPLVLLHGGHGNWLHWVRNIEPLAARFTVWVPDLPGYGDSDMPQVPSDGTGWPPPQVSLDALLSATIATLDALIGADTPVDIVGFSFGALVAACLARQRPGVGQLALLGPAGHGGRRRPRGEMLGWREAVQDPDPGALAAVMRHNLAVQMLEAPAADIDPLALAVHTRACLRARFRSREISRAGGLPAALANGRSRLLLAWGEHDATADPGPLARDLAPQAPGRQTHIEPGVGHWVQYEGAPAINRLLLDWLTAGR